MRKMLIEDRKGKHRKAKQMTAVAVLGLLSSVSFLVLGTILYFLIRNGASAFSWEFLTEFPRRMMTEGGILPAIVGSIYLTAGAVLVALPFALGAAIWLTEYSGGGWWVRAIRIGVNTLAGVPSIVFGLLGLALFVITFGFGVSILSGALTLAILILPIMIRSAEEALSAVPRSFREGALALGSSRWRTVRTVVLPSALPGILTGTVLSLSRAMGETAPIMFTAVAYSMLRLPNSPTDKCMALPYHIFVMATESPSYGETRNLQFGAALMLLALVLVLNLFAIVWRTISRRRKAW